MKYAPIDPQLFIENRRRLLSLLLPKSLAIFNANDFMPTNADGTMGFRQNSDLFYLTGIDQEETILLLFPDAPRPEWREILFLRETNEHIAVWEGYKYTREHAQAVSGIETIMWSHQLEGMMKWLAFEAQYLYLNTNEHSRNASEVQTRDARFIQRMKESYPLHRFERLAPLMHHLRATKSAVEVGLLQEAIRITQLGFERVARFLKPGVMEYEIEAEFLHEFVRNRSNGFAYQPIIAAGGNSCVLHYIENSRPCHDGDLLLLDVAASYANYNADLTRVLPVSGRFTPRQRAVYEAVLRTMKFTKSCMKPGATWDDNQRETEKFIEAELVQLGLLSKEAIAHQDPKNPLYKRYFMHGVSHFLGLDVHDVGIKYRAFEPGMVFTCEPGIYIPEERIGIRLENNILITENGHTDLMESIPLEADAIENLMNP
jgi:Xaa-Pro aminopeptidase